MDSNAIDRIRKRRSRDGNCAVAHITATAGIRASKPARVRAGLMLSGCQLFAPSTNESDATCSSRPGNDCQICGGKSSNCSVGTNSSILPRRASLCGTGWRTSSFTRGAHQTQASKAAKKPSCTMISALGLGEPPPPKIMAIATNAATSRPCRDTGVAFLLRKRPLPVRLGTSLA